jgi:hypothetical protein
MENFSKLPVAILVEGSESSDPVKRRAKSAAYNSSQRRRVRDLIRQFLHWRFSFAARLELGKEETRKG